MTEANQSLSGAAITAAPMRSDLGEIFNVSIRQVSYGYIVEVGCRTFAIEDSNRLIDLLGRYLKSPNEVHQQYNEGKLFQKSTE